jgi:hypothetical protein
MAILLFSNSDILIEQATYFAGDQLAVLLTTDESALTAPLQARLEDLIVADVQGPRLGRLNFDAIALAVVDLTPEMLLSSGGRRLLDVLGRLATDPDEPLHLAFYGPALGVIGAFLEDGVTAGLNLLPRTVVVPNMKSVADLRALLLNISERGLRLLALDQPVCARYEAVADTVAVRGAGGVLLTAFRRTPANEQPTARLHVLTDKMSSGWPD